MPVPDSRFIHFGIFEVDLQSEELRKGGVRLKLSGQPFQVLAILLENSGDVVTREELQKRLWPDTFVDVDHNLNTAINKIREALSDSSENPRFIETLPRRGYRFIAPIESTASATPEPRQLQHRPQSTRLVRPAILFAAALLLLAGGTAIYELRRSPTAPVQRALTRITFDSGIQTGVTWSPDGRYIAYASDRGGKFDIWVQQVSGGAPIQITKGPGQNWQPDWSPDGKHIAYRSEDGEGGLFIVPALGGEGWQRKIASFGYFPQWSPDGTAILLSSTDFNLPQGLYVVASNGQTSPHRILSEINKWILWAAWHPDGKHVTLRTWSLDKAPVPVFLNCSVDSSEPPRPTELTPEVERLAGVAAGEGTGPWADIDSRFTWDRSGRALYFERSFRGARNIWRLVIDPQTLHVSGIDRITTGSEFESDLALSSDSASLAFTSESNQTRAWIFPFDSVHGRLLGEGTPATSPSIEAWEGSLTADGQKFAFSSKRAGKLQLWQSSLPSGTESPVLPEDTYIRDEPHWSPDGSRLAYARLKPDTGEMQAVIWDPRSRTETAVTPASRRTILVFDWFPDGQSLLASWDNERTTFTEIWKLPVPGSANSGRSQKLVAADLNQNFWQGRVSPDGSWIAFEHTANTPDGTKSAIFVAPANGGSAVRLTPGILWEDKPRWSADGRTIYFISHRAGFLNVFGIRFDPATGHAVGEPFQATQFNNFKQMIARNVPNLGFAVSKDRLVVTVSQRSGNLWVLDNLSQ